MKYMKMNQTLGFVLACICAIVTATALAAAPPTELDTVLAQMDKASATFQSAEADFHKDLYEAIVKQTTPQTGTLYVQRKGKTTQMGLRITGAGAQIVEYKNGTVRRFLPGLKCYETYTNLNQGGVESFLTLGFGGSGKELAQTWNVTDQGTEKMTDGKEMRSVEKLDLVAKDPKVKSNFTHVTLWIDAERGVSLKQEFFTPSGDTQTATYTNIRVNQSVNLKPYEITGNSCAK